VTKQEASIFLGIEDFESFEEALEFRLFELKQQLISKPCIPQLLQARLSKLKQLKEACRALEFEIESTTIELKINELNIYSLTDCFNSFLKNKNIILTRISSNLTIDLMEISINLLLENLKVWSKLWPKITILEDEKIVLSKELESMEFYQVLKELKQINVLNFKDLDFTQLPENLNHEIKRLNIISEYFSQD
jgi:hypothetical protein